MLWLAMILYYDTGLSLYYDTGLRNSQQHLWTDLNFAWCATFHSNLHQHMLEMWPKDAPHAFTEMQSKWLADALRKALDDLRVVAPQHSLRSLHLRL